jgi:MFS transporter, FSR family, fosmidomycin resistance protein
MAQVIRRPSILSLPIVLGCAHGVADAAAGFLLGTLHHQRPLNQALLLVLLYNVLAFGYQPLLGWLSDRLQCSRLAVSVGLLALAASLLIVPHSLVLAISLAGGGSAIFHVGGAALTYLATPYPTRAAGIFTAPGVVGLTIGGIAGYTGVSLAPALLVSLIGLAGAIAQCRNSNFNAPPLYLPHRPYPPHPSQPPIPNTQLLLLSAIALISTVWTGVQLLLIGQAQWLLAVAIAAALGKLVGGHIAETVGYRRWAIAALLAAIPLLLLGRTVFLFLLPGVALLQSSVPITLTATIQQMPHQPATAAGLALGLAILIGGVPVLIGVNLFAYTWIGIGVLLLLSIVLLRMTLVQKR